MKRIFYYLSLIFVSAAVFSCCTAEFVNEEGPLSLDGGEQGAGTVLQESRTSTVEVLLSEELCELVERDLAEGNLVTRSPELNAFSELMGVVSITRIFYDEPEYEPALRRAGLHRWYKVTFLEKQSATRAVSGLLELDGIESATPARKIQRTAVSFNDPELYRQWHYYNDGSRGYVFSAGCDINVAPVWEEFTTGDPSVIVGVVDGGIDHSHPDLADNYVGGFNFVRNNNNVTADNHGTHVAGTVAAVNNNRTGVAGVAGGDAAAGKPGAGLLSCQIFEGDYGADASNAIIWGANHGAVISQNSWGYSFDSDDEARAAANMGLAAFSPALKAAIDYFIDYAGCDPATGNQRADSPMRGGLYITSAGNDNRSYDVIGEYERVVAVAAIGPDFRKASYSNYGNWVDICAPGGEAGYGASAEVYSTLPGGSYGYYQGTSMACPHVSGVAALIVSYFGGQGFTNTQLRGKLLGGANEAVMENVNARTYVGPLVDAYGAMTFGGVTPPDNVDGYTVATRSNSLEFSWNVTEGAGIKAYGYLLMAAKDPALLVRLDPASPLPDGVIGVKVSTDGYRTGQKMTGRIEDLEFNTTYYTAIAGYNSNNYYSLPVNGNGQVISASVAPLASVTAGNNAPELSAKGETSITLKAHETGSLYFSITEPDGHPFDVSLESQSPAASLKAEGGANYSLYINAPAGDAGNYQALVTATDKYGLSSSLELRYTILENNPPVMVKNVENILMSRIGERVTLDMTEYISDPDGETLRYAANLSTTTNLSLTQNGDEIELRSTNFGETTVTMRGTDVKGKYCTVSFVVLARDPSIPIDVYPNPVIDNLTVRPYKETSQARVTIVSSAGATVVDHVGSSSPFDPVKVNMGGVAPGKYVVNVSFDGETYQRTIVKQ